MKKVITIFSVVILLAACSTKQRVVTHTAFQAERIASYDSISLLIDFSPVIIEAAKSIADSSQGSKSSKVRITGSVHRNVNKTVQVADTTIKSKPKVLSISTPKVFEIGKWIGFSFIVFLLVIGFKFLIKRFEV